jgi:hypothetical protein
MERILFGDNQFFGVNHASDEKSRAQLMKFKEDDAIIKTLDDAKDLGVNSFMCTTYERVGHICEHMLKHPAKYENYHFYPCMPYAYKYANAVTELGIIGALKHYMPGNFVSSILKGGMAYLSKDYLSIMELLVDAEMKMFKGVSTPVIFLQNVITDLLLGLNAIDVLVAFHEYVQKKYQAEAGFITMNFPRLLEALEQKGITNPIICTSVNVSGFRMSGGKELYEKTLATKQCRVIAMQVFGGGILSPKKAIEYVCSLPNIESILFGASSKGNIASTVNLIQEYDARFAHVLR